MLVGTNKKRFCMSYGISICAALILKMEPLLLYYASGKNGSWYNEIIHKFKYAKENEMALKS